MGDTKRDKMVFGKRDMEGKSEAMRLEQARFSEDMNSHLGEWDS